MRKNIHLLPHKNHRNEVDHSCRTDCSFAQTRVPITANATFIRCTFINMNCTDDMGGAISCRQSSITVILNVCTFEDCSSVSCGGAIYVSGNSNILEIIDSLFCRCITTKTGENNQPGGGGICMSGSSSSLTIRASTFVSCKAQVSPRGGGACLPSQIKDSHCFSCSFISCATANAGGALFFFQLTDIFEVSDSLFSGNSAKWSGGAIRELSNELFEQRHLQFLFFTCNEAPEHYGNDFSVEPEIGGSPFHFSFSTTASNRLAYATGESVRSYNDDWLPLTNIIETPESARMHSNDGIVAFYS